MFGMNVRFTAQPGEGDSLAAILVEAAAGAEDDHSCLLYVVSREDGDPDTVWVFEAWTDRDAHDESLQDEDTRALIGRAMPLLDGSPEATELEPAGGKGLEAGL